MRPLLAIAWTQSHNSPAARTELWDVKTDMLVQKPLRKDNKHKKKI